MAGSDKFTPVLQDHLGLALLVGRDYPKWWTGAITDRQFAHNISLEWASLPDPENGGKSHYDGVGPNHASTTLDDVCICWRAPGRQCRRPVRRRVQQHRRQRRARSVTCPRRQWRNRPLEWIKDIQTILQSAGVYTGDIDGIFGQGSEDAFNDLLDAARH